jgi:HlyD family secretion protein
VNHERPTVIRARRLVKTCRMGEVEVQALRGVDFDLVQGELVVLLGPSGSGKSTLLNILGGLDGPTSARIDLHEGDVVEPGMVLARLLPLPSPLLDPRSRQVAVERLASAIDSQRQAEATVTRAEAADEQARRDLARVEALAKEGSLPPAQLDQTGADARMREAELASARFSEKVAAHDIEQARAALERFSPGARPSEQFEVTSPVHGQVLHVLRKSEGVLEAGTALLEVGDPSALELVVDVLSQDAVAVRPGMPARVLHWGGEPELGAKVRRVEPSAFTKTSALGVDEQRVNVLLDLASPKDAWRSLGDGFAPRSRSRSGRSPTSCRFRRARFSARAQAGPSSP